MPPLRAQIASDGQQNSSESLDRPRRSTLTKISPAQAVQLLMSQISEYSGAEEDDVDMWLRKIEKVARIHEVSSDVVLLAASSKLTKAARKWYELTIGPASESWQDFKTELSLRFKRTVPHHVIIKKVEARKWNPVKESFADYANEKLVLMHRLKLSDQDAILYLMNGINNLSLRALAASLKVETINDFLREMHRITLSSADMYKKPYISSKAEKPKDRTTSSAKPSSPKKTDRDVFCAYCKIKGHVKADCYKLKRK